MRAYYWEEKRAREAAIADAAAPNMRRRGHRSWTEVAVCSGILIVAAGFVAWVAWQESRLVAYAALVAAAAAAAGQALSKRRHDSRCWHEFRPPIPGYGGYYGIYCLLERGHSGPCIETRDECLGGTDW